MLGGKRYMHTGKSSTSCCSTKPPRSTVSSSDWLRMRTNLWRRLTAMIFRQEPEGQGLDTGRCECWLRRAEGPLALVQLCSLGSGVSSLRAMGLAPETSSSPHPSAVGGGPPEGSSGSTQALVRGKWSSWSTRVSEVETWLGCSFLGPRI